MKITIEIDSDSEMEKLSALLLSFNINTVNLTSVSHSSLSIIKGDKNINPKGLFGIWANNPQSLEIIRAKGWQRNNSN